MARGSGLEDDADDGDEASAPDEDDPPAEAVGGVAGEEGADEAPRLQRAHNVCVEVGPVDVAGVLWRELVESAELASTSEEDGWLGGLLLEFGHAEDAADDACVNSEDQASKTCLRSNISMSFIPQGSCGF